MPRNIFVITFLTPNKFIFVNTNMNDIELNIYIEKHINESLYRNNQEINFFNNIIRIEDFIDKDKINDIKKCKSLEAYREHINNISESNLFSYNILSMDVFLSENVYTVRDDIGQEKIVRGLYDRMSSCDLSTKEEAFVVLESYYHQLVAK